MKKEIIDTVQQKFTKLYLVYMLIVFPLYYHNNYIDIMEAKRLVYIWGTGIYVISMLLLSLSKQWGCKIAIRKNRSTYDWLLLALALVLVLGLVACPDRINSLMGYGAKCTGLILYLLGIGAIYYIGKYGEWSAGVTWAMMFGSIIVGVLQILNRWGIDPLHMYDNLAEEDIQIFVSTIGQVNYNAAYDCMMLSVFMVLFMICKERISQLMYATCMVVLMTGMMSCCSNAAYVALLVIFYILCIYAYRYKEKAGRLAMTAILMDFSAYLIWKLFLIKRVYLWDLTEMIYNARLHRFITGGVILFVVGCLLCQWLCKRKEDLAERIWHIYLILIMVGIPLGVAFAIYRFTNHYNMRAQILWSSYRMEIWSNCLTLFGKSNLWHKLFGWGFNCIYPALETMNLHKLAGVPIVDAHNLLLNSLLTSGLLGTVCWCIYLVYLFRQAKQKCLASSECWISMCGIIVYLVLGIFNGPQVLTTPMFLLFLGVYSTLLREQ